MKAEGLAPTLHRIQRTGLDSSYPIHVARNTRDTKLAEILSARHLIGFANTHPDGASDWIRRSAKRIEQSTEAVRQQTAIEKKPGLNPESRV